MKEWGWCFCHGDKVGAFPKRKKEKKKEKEKGWSERSKSGITKGLPERLFFVPPCMSASCVYVCRHLSVSVMCVRERERQKERERGTTTDTDKHAHTILADESR